MGGLKTLPYKNGRTIHKLVISYEKGLSFQKEIVYNIRRSLIERRPTVKRDQHTVDMRRSLILKKIRQEQTVLVEDLAQEFQMSAMSVRRDLQFLEDRGLITRFYGGATINPMFRAGTPAEELDLYRRLLGRYAATRVRAGETIFINGSNASLGLVDFLTVPGVHLVTNNGLALNKKMPKDGLITLTGGELRENVMVGDLALRSLLDFHANKTFLGCARVTPKGEFSYNIPMEIGINETMIARTTGELYILADHTKFSADPGSASPYGSCTYDRQVTLITDEKTDAEIVAELRTIGIEVFQVGINDITF